MSVLGALGRSKTYSESASDQDKDRFRIALRKNLSEIGNRYVSPVPEEEHLSNIKKFADDLTLNFSHCLENGRFRIGIAQKALNLYLKYLWCVDLIPMPPHCPFDSIIINRLPDCRALNWTVIDTIDEYKELVDAAIEETGGKAIAEWELEIWLKSVQSIRERKSLNWPGTGNGKKVPLEVPSQLNSLRKEGDAMIKATVTSQGKYADEKDICELYVSADSSDRLPHEYKKRKSIDIRIGEFIYEAGVHETQNGVVWLSSVLFKKERGREKTRLVDALEEINVGKGHRVKITPAVEGTYLLEKCSCGDTPYRNA